MVLQKKAAYCEANKKQNASGLPNLPLKNISQRLGRQGHIRVRHLEFCHLMHIYTLRWQLLTKVWYLKDSQHGHKILPVHWRRFWYFWCGQVGFSGHLICCWKLPLFFLLKAFSCPQSHIQPAFCMCLGQPRADKRIAALFILEGMGR